MARPQERELTARIVVETGAEADRTLHYVIQAMKSACRNIRDGAVTIALYDENDRFLGMDVSGQPTEAFQERIDEMLDGDEVRPAS